MKKKYLVLSAVTGLIIALDQLTKTLILKDFRLGESFAIIPNFFNLTYVRNPGAAFGFLANSHPEFREVFFLAMPPVALIIILMILRTVKDEDKWQIFALSSIFGGAIGNYVDRLRFRYVVDFLDFHIAGQYSWPAFNLADSAIVGGVGILLVLMWFEKKDENKVTA